MSAGVCPGCRAKVKVRNGLVAAHRTLTSDGRRVTCYGSGKAPVTTYRARPA